MQNEAISVQVPHQVYLDLAFKLRNMGDTRDPDEAVVAALKAWLAGRQQTLQGGYQWKELFLPDGTELRLRYRGAYNYASVDGDQLKYAGEVVSPRDWALMVTGSVRNPWRDIRIRCGVNEAWTRASAWRVAAPYSPILAHTDRRRRTRRVTD